jgi:hypothetical protein
MMLRSLALALTFMGVAMMTFAGEAEARKGWGYTKAASIGGCGPRPRAWCGWWMNRQKGCVLGRAGNLARNWCGYGRPASPQPGAIVVWGRGKRGGHVGKIVSMVNRCTAVVVSGNDGGAVRTRPRSVCNAVCVRS